MANHDHHISFPITRAAMRRRPSRTQRREATPIEKSRSLPADTTMAELWREARELNGGKDPESLEFDIRTGGKFTYHTPTSGRKDHVLIMAGHMHGQVYFGWYVDNGFAKIWSCYGNMTPRQVYGQPGLWVG